MIFSPRYFLAFLLFLIIEICIAAFVHDAIIRPFLGDSLAVICLYFLLRSFLRLGALNAVLLSLGIAFFLEFLQYIHFIRYTGLEQYRILAIVLGTSYDWRDLLAYTLGAIPLLFEKATFSDLKRRVGLQKL